MVYAKVAGGVLFLLLLACFEAIPLPPAAIANDVRPHGKRVYPPAPPPPPSTEECTRAQKVEILCECEGYIKIHNTIRYPTNNSLCCNAVRNVPNLDIFCIYDLLTSREKNMYHPRRFKYGLRNFCSL
uniref:Bifunctional inhibitor/plant lipid transfer protein/seed storage helical domain-containing protein n=1 Tax=Leersia perrieri TaxID=77586 RepID=A0A0D9XY67_9ORYZ